MDNKEQLLKDYVATAQARNYDWEVVNSKFPEIDDLIKSMGLPSSVAKPKIEQLLKDYVATAEKREYDWALVNSKFPEFFPELKKKESGLDTEPAVPTATSPSQPSVEPSVSSTGEPQRPSTGKPGYTSKEALEAAERDNWDVLGDYVSNAWRWASVPGILVETVSAVSEGEVPFIRRIKEGTLLLGDEKYTKPKYTGYSFGDAEPLIKELENSSILNAKKWVEEYKNSEEFSQLVSDGEARIKEIDKEVAYLTEAARKTVNANRASSLTNRVEKLNQERESLTEEGILQSKFQSDFVQDQKQRVLNELPEEYRNDPVFLENLSDRFYYESQLPLDLDGNRVYNDIPWFEGGVKAFESGVKNITDALEYTATFAAVTSSPLPKIASEEIMMQKRSEINEQNERIATSTAQFTLGITDSIANRDYSNAVKQLVNGTAQSLPLIALSGVTGGVGGTAAIAASALVNGWVSGVGTYVQIRDMKDDDGNEIYGEEGALGYAFSSATAEGVFSLVGSHIAKLAAGQKAFLTSKDFLNAGLRAQYGGVTPMLKSYLKGALKRKGIAFAEEGLTEFSTEFANQVVDSISRKDGKKFSLKEAFNNSLDAFIQGGAAGLVFDSFGSIQGNGIKETSVAFANSQDSFYIENIAPIDNAIYLLNNALEIEANVETKALISQQIEELNKKRETIVDERSTYFQALFVKDNKLFQEVAKVNNEIAKARIELKKAEKSGNQAAIDAAKNKIKGLIESKSKSLPDVIDITPEIAKKISDRKIDEKTKRYERAEQDALADLEVLEGMRESVIESGNQNRIDSYERAVDSARKRVEEISSKKSEVESIMDRVFEARRAFNEMSPSDRADSEFFDNVKKELADAENQLFEALNIDSFGSTSADIASFIDEGVVETEVPVRDKAWDDAKKASLPSRFQTVEQLQEILNNGTWGMLTAENPMRSRLSEEENARRNEEALEWLRKKGYDPIQIFGKYENSESSFFVEGLSKKHALEFAEKFGQESVAHSEGMFYQNGDFNPRQPGSSTGGNPTDFYSTTNINGELVDFQIDYDFDTRLDSDGNKVEKKPEGKETASVDRESRVNEIVSNRNSDEYIVVTANKDGSISLPQDLLGLSDTEYKSLIQFIQGVSKTLGYDVPIVIGKKDGFSESVSDVAGKAEFNGAFVPTKDGGVIFIDPSKLKDDTGTRVLFEELFHSVFSPLLTNLPPAEKVKVTTQLLDSIKGDKDLTLDFIEKAFNYAAARLNVELTSDLDENRKILSELGDEAATAISLLNAFENAREGKLDADEVAVILSNEPILFDEAVTQVASLYLEEGKIPQSYREKIKTLLRDLLNKLGLGKLAVVDLSDPKSFDDIVRGIVEVSKGRAITVKESASQGASFSQIFRDLIPPKLRSLNGFSKAEWVELNPKTEFLSVDALPDGPFEMSYIVIERLYGRGDNQTTVTRKFNNREHFINWWKKTNIIPENQFSGPQNLGNVSGAKISERDTKSVFSEFKVDGKMIDVSRLEKMYLDAQPEAKGAFYVRGKGAYQFTRNRMVEDLTLALQDGTISKKEYYNYLGAIKRQTDGLTKEGDEFVKNKQYWETVDALKELHVRLINNAFSDIRRRGDSRFQPRLDIERNENGTVKRTEKGYFPDFPTYKSYRDEVANSINQEGTRFSYAKSQEEGYKERVEEVKSQSPRKGVRVDRNAQRFVSASMVEESYGDLPVEERARRAFVDDARAVLREAKTKWEVVDEYTPEVKKFVSNICEKHGIPKSQGWENIYSLIHAMTSNGQKESQNTAAAIIVFDSMVAHFNRTGELRIPDKVMSSPEVRRTIRRFSNFEVHVERLNDFLNRTSKAGNKSFYNPETKSLNSNAILASLYAKSGKEGRVFVQDLFGQTSDAGKLGAYALSLMGDLDTIVIDSHTIEQISIYTGDVREPFSAESKNRAMSEMEEVLGERPKSFEEGYKAMMELKKKLDPSKKADLKKKDKICAIVEMLVGGRDDKSSSAMKIYKEHIEYISRNTSEQEAASIGFDIYEADGKTVKEKFIKDGVFYLPPFYVHQILFASNQLRTAGNLTSPGDELRRYNNSEKLSPSLDYSSTAEAQVANQIEFEKESETESSSFRTEMQVVAKNSNVYRNVTFSANDSEISKVRNLDGGSVSESLNIDGRKQKVKTGPVYGLVRLSFNPLIGNRPQLPDGRFVDGADSVFEINGVYYAKGNIKIADEASSRNTKTEKNYRLIKDEKNKVAEILKPVAAQLKMTVDEVYKSLPRQVQRDIAKGENNADKGIRHSLVGKRLRRTAGRAAAKFPGIKQDILDNPENYITPQNLQAVKDRLESLSEADLFDLMRDDVLGRLQNRNDDTGALAGAELVKRAIERGDMDAVPDLIADLAKIGTSAGRILRHFRELKLQDPIGSTVSFIEAEVRAGGNSLSDAQKQKLSDIVGRLQKASDEYKDLVRRSQNGEDLELELKKATEQISNAQKELSTFANAVIERGWGDIGKMLVQGNLLTPMSHVTNVGSNMINLLGKSFVDIIAIPVERFSAMLGMQTEYKRSYSFMAHVHAWKAFGLGLAEGTKSAVTGKTYEADTEWSMQRGFMPVQSLLSAMSKEDLPLNEKGNPSISQKMKLWVQATLGVPAEANFRLLSIGDIPFRRFAEAKELYNIGRTKGLQGEALSKFMKNPDKKSAEIARREGRKLTFQQETTASEMTNKAVRSIENLMATSLEFAIGNKVANPEQVARFIMATAVPYRTTPANLLHETLTYVAPPYAIARIAAGVRRKDARAVSENFGKMVVGSALTMTAAMLIKEGLMSAPLDWEDDEEKNIAYDQFPPASVNISGLQRWINGEDPSKQEDDYFVSYEKLGIPGAVLGAVAKGVTKEELNSIEYENMNSSYKMFMNAIGINPAAGVSHMMDQSFMQGMQTLVSTMASSVGSDDFSKNLERWVASYFKAATATVLPNTLSTLNRMNREYIPDMRVTKDMSATERILKQLEYTIKDRTFNTSEIPVRVDWKGNPIKQTPRGASPIAYQLFDITKARQGEDDPLSNEIYRIYEATGVLTELVGTPGYAQKRAFKAPKRGGLSKKEMRAIDKLPRKYTFFDDDEFLSRNLFLNTTELNKLMELSGKHRYNKALEFMKTNEFKKMSDDERAEAFNNIEKKYVNKIEMDGDNLMPHSIEILNIMQDKYEDFKEQ